MSETDFQVLYKQYTETANNPIERKKVIEQLHHLVYTYPLRRFRADADTASDFYMYYYSRIATLFEEYDQSVPFLVYLSVKLKFAFFRFLNRNPKNTTHLTWQDEVGLGEVENKKSSQSSQRKIVLTAIESLKNDDELRLRLYFGFQLYLSHFRDLLKRKNSFSIFHLYRQYLKQVEVWLTQVYKEKEEILYRLSAIEEDNKETYKTLNREQLLERFFKFKPPVKLKTIAEMLNEGISKVQRRIQSALLKVKEMIKRELPYFRRIENAE